MVQSSVPTLDHAAGASRSVRVRTQDGAFAQGMFNKAGPSGGIRSPRHSAVKDHNLTLQEKSPTTSKKAEFATHHSSSTLC
jgi:hypothetical protein